MNNYEKLKNNHPLRRDIALIFVLLILILVAIIFPRFTNKREPLDETEIIYFEHDNIGTLMDPMPDAPEPDIVGYLLQKKNEKRIPPEIIDEAIDFEWPVLDTFSIESLIINTQKNGGPPPPVGGFVTGGQPKLGFDSISTSNTPFFLQGATIYDTPPEPVGGYDAIYYRLFYPSMLYKKNIEGTVFIQIIVLENGALGAVRVLKSSGWYYFDKAACDAVTNAKWMPGKNRDHNVPIVISFPIKFSKHDGRIIPPPPPPPKKDSKQSLEISIIPKLDLEEIYPQDTFDIIDHLNKYTPPPDNKSIYQGDHYSSPHPIGGVQAINDNIDYSDKDWSSVLKDRVIIQAYIDTNGTATQALIMSSCGNKSLDKAALNAIKKTKWIPAQQEDNKRGVWIAIPVTFKLNK